MGLDLRLPIGLLLSIIGVLLTGYGLLSDPQVYQRSLGININLWWGLVLFLTGAILLLLARRAASRSHS
jgi:hypothetical protein